MICSYCNRNYKLQHNYQEHIIECKLLHEPKDDNFTLQEMSKIIKKMSLKINKLEKEVECFKNTSKRNIRKNILQVLGEPKYLPCQLFNHWINTFQVKDEHMNVAIEEGILKGFKNCIEFNLNNNNNNQSLSKTLPICSFIEKPGYIYVFTSLGIENSQENQWQVFEHEHMKIWIKHICQKFLKLYLTSQISSSISQDMNDLNTKIIVGMRQKLFDKHRNELKRWIYNQICKELPIITEIEL